MIKSYHKTFPLYLMVDFLLIFLVFYGCYLFRYNSLHSMLTQLNLPDIGKYSIIFFIWALFIFIFFKKSSLYITDRELTIPKETFKVVTNLLYVGMLIGGIIFFIQYKFFSRDIFLKSFFLLCVTLSIWRILKRLILRTLIKGGFHNINVLIIGVGKMANLVVEEIKRNPYWGFNVVGALNGDIGKTVGNAPVLGKVKDCIEIAKRYFVDEIIVTDFFESEQVSKMVKEAKGMHLGLRILPENLEEAAPFVSTTHLGIIPLITYQERKHRPIELVLKRVFDFFIALILLIIFFPLGLIIAVLIKFDSVGPVFYIKERSGFKGKRFVFYKFRSMIIDADEQKAELLNRNEVKDGVIFKIKKDPRITKVGRFLRKHSLDELPQLINVLIGDMGLVGPRPPTPDEVEKYSHEYMQRLAIRPGMTCLSQVRGRSDLTFRKWVKWDLWYMNNWSIWLDFKILWLTTSVVIKGKGAY